MRIAPLINMSKLGCIVCAVLVSTTTPALADTVTCSDGSTSQDIPGACSHHGGVVDVRAKPRAERPRAPKRSQARMTTPRRRTPMGVLCTDGTRSTSSARAACSGHGGIAGTISIEHDRSARRTVATPQPPRIERSAPPRQTEPTPSDLDTILCNDGTESPIGREACATHGGVSNGAEMFERHEGPLRERAPSTERGPSTQHLPGAGVPAPLAPVAICKDGEISYDYAEGGACAYRDNFGRWL